MVPLANLSPGQTGFVQRLHGGHRFLSRLAALGFTPGAPVIMMRNHGFGPVIVAIRGAQVALGRGEATHILVHPTEDEKHEPHTN